MSLRHSFCTGLLFTLGSILNALPDPDLFDGRVSQFFTASGGEEIKNGVPEKVSDEQSGNFAESRDYSQFDGADIDQSVSVGNSKNGESAERSISASASTGSVPQITEAHDSKSKASASSARTQRNFADFEIGSYNDSEAAVEVNRSRELTEESSAKSDSTLPSESTAQNSGTDKTIIQEQTKKSGSVDFGSDLPSGL